MLDSKKMDEVKNTVWSACDTFRGVLDASEYKDYILVFLFLKYISDVWKEHSSALRERYGSDEERIRRRMERERFVLPPGQAFDDLYQQRNADNIGELIDIALDAIEENNKTKLEGVFRNVSFNSETKLGSTKDRNRRLKNLLEDFSALDLSPSQVSEDVIGEAYIYLIEQFAQNAGKKAGEFYTPRQVARLLAKLAAPKHGDMICDPSCGSGSLLIRAAEEIGDRNFALFGQEVNGGTWALARMNMFLHGLDSARIEWGDTLNDPKLLTNDALMKFDVVLANPPFSLDKWGAENASRDRYARFWRGVPPKSKGDFAFITHMIECAKVREGRVAVVAPHGVLFRGGAEGRIREKMIEENLLDAVIGLPPNLFPTTTIPVAILVFDRTREDGGVNHNRSDVMFIDASRDYQAEKAHNAILDSHIERIISTYRNRQVVDRYAQIAAREDIVRNHFNLNISLYFDSFGPEQDIDISAVQKEIEALENELAVVRSTMHTHLKELGFVS